MMDSRVCRDTVVGTRMVDGIAVDMAVLSGNDEAPLRAEPSNDIAKL